MADAQIGNVHGVAAVNVGDSDTPTNFNGTNVIDAGFVDTDAVTIAAAKTRLQAIDATSYSDERLAQMTFNDMVYALRVHDSPGTLK